jgi:hypothetical protein
MEQLRDDMRALAADFTAHILETQRARPAGMHDGEPQAAIAVPGQIVIVGLPAHSEPHLAADLRRFIDAQCAELGVTIPVLITLGDVTVEPR